MQLVLRLALSFSLSQKLLMLCIAYCSVTAWFFPNAFLEIVGHHTSLQPVTLVSFIMLLGMIAVTALHKPDSPIRFLRQLAAERGTGALITVMAMLISSSAFTALKHNYTKLVPFFADPAVAALDRALHFGDPAQWLRMIIPDVLDYPLFCFYSLLWFLEVVAGVAIAAWLPQRGLRERYLACFTIGVMGLSSVVRVAVNAAGPIFYDRVHGGSRFAWLTEALQAGPGGVKALEFSDYLYSSYVTGTTVLGSGISAMPSLHVALAFLNALFFARLNRVTAVIGWSYFAVILTGSVYFGWHYAVDGYVSIAVMLVLWRVFRGSDDGRRLAQQSWQ